MLSVNCLYHVKGVCARGCLLSGVSPRTAGEHWIDPRTHEGPGPTTDCPEYRQLISSYLHPLTHDRGDSGRLTSRKLHGHELRRLLAHVGYRVPVAPGRPRNVAGFEVHGRGPLAFNISAYVDIRNRDHKVRPVVTMAWNDSSGLELDFGNTGVVLYEKYFLRASVQDMKAAFLIPLGRRRAEFFVLHELDSDVAERPAGKIAGDMGEAGGRESCLTVL